MWCRLAGACAAGAGKRHVPPSNAAESPRQNILIAKFARGRSSRRPTEFSEVPPIRPVIIVAGAESARGSESRFASLECQKTTFLLSTFQQKYLHSKRTVAEGSAPVGRKQKCVVLEELFIRPIVGKVYHSSPATQNRDNHDFAWREMNDLSGRGRVDLGSLVAPTIFVFRFYSYDVLHSILVCSASYRAGEARGGHADTRYVRSR